jgi:hypothetical protein
MSTIAFHSAEFRSAQVASSAIHTPPPPVVFVGGGGGGGGGPRLALRKCFGSAHRFPLTPALSPIKKTMGEREQSKATA